MKLPFPEATSMLADQSQADKAQNHATHIPQRQVLVKESQPDPNEQPTIIKDDWEIEEFGTPRAYAKRINKKAF